jgi:putative glutamine amidotransferase
MVSRPVVLIPCDVKRYGEYPFHCVGEKYINAVAHGAGAMPLLMPAWGRGAELCDLTDLFELDVILDRVHGVFLPGSTSNVHPHRYGGADMDMLHDEQRDAGVFPLIERTLSRGLPLLAVCRGLQELNVALGGTLHPRIHELPGYLDHRENDELPRDAQYGLVHAVDAVHGGMLAELVGAERFLVNSLHAQGIAELGAGLRVEARAEDGLIEAVSMVGAWVLGVQWHPEWHFTDDAASAKLFAGFGEALRAA